MSALFASCTHARGRYVQEEDLRRELELAQGYDEYDAEPQAPPRKTPEAAGASRRRSRSPEVPSSNTAVKRQCADSPAADPAPPYVPRTDPRTELASADPQKSCPTCPTGPCLVIRTSRSAQNPDRKFFKCDTCNHFEWADATGPPLQQRALPVPAKGAGAEGGSSAGGAIGDCYKCG
jgi:DNA-directed RNA polymerase subunit M/transcription elongation factor TFIIS